VDAAIRLAAEATAIARSSTLRLRLAYALTVLAGCHRRRDELRRARTAADEAFMTSQDCGYPFGNALALVELGEIALAHGQTQRAREHWVEAERILHEIGCERSRQLQARRTGLPSSQPPHAPEQP
jgi:tetratricopeptide (TPR) repeat protein